MKNLLSLLAFFSFFTATDPSLKILNNSRGPVITAISNKFNVRIYGIGGSMPEKLKNIFMSFKSPESIPKDHIQCARKKIVEIANFAIHKFSNDTKLISILEAPPFNVNNLKLGLSFDAGYNDSYYLAYVLLSNGKVTYTINIHDEEPLVDVYEETFDEALKQLNSNIENQEHQ
jgi:hypothetical protein